MSNENYENEMGNWTPPLPASAGSAIRAHDEQTPLERLLRSHLWYPNDILARGAKELPKCLKAKEYRQAADWQELMRKAENEITDWTHILELYEQERQSSNDHAEPLLPGDARGGH